MREGRLSTRLDPWGSCEVFTPSLLLFFQLKLARGLTLSDLLDKPRLLVPSPSPLPPLFDRG